MTEIKCRAKNPATCRVHGANVTRTTSNLSKDRKDVIAKTTSLILKEMNTVLELSEELAKILMDPILRKDARSLNVMIPVCHDLFGSLSRLAFSADIVKSNIKSAAEESDVASPKSTKALKTAMNRLNIIYGVAGRENKNYKDNIFGLTDPYKEFPEDIEWITQVQDKADKVVTSARSAYKSWAQLAEPILKKNTSA
jgi:hypothetical protein